MFEFIEMNTVAWLFATALVALLVRRKSLC